MWKILFCILFAWPKANFGLLLSEQHQASLHSIFINFCPKNHHKPHKKVGTLILGEHPMGFELGTF